MTEQRETIFLDLLSSIQDRLSFLEGEVESMRKKNEELEAVLEQLKASLNSIPNNVIQMVSPTLSVQNNPSSRMSYTDDLIQSTFDRALDIMKSTGFIHPKCSLLSEDQRKCFSASHIYNKFRKDFAKENKIDEYDICTGKRGRKPILFVFEGVRFSDQQAVDWYKQYVMSAAEQALDGTPAE